jgi:hypothetical protein
LESLAIRPTKSVNIELCRIATQVRNPDIFITFDKTSSGPFHHRVDRIPAGKMPSLNGNMSGSTTYLSCALDVTKSAVRRKANPSNVFKLLTALDEAASPREGRSGWVDWLGAD